MRSLIRSSAPSLGRNSRLTLVFAVLLAVAGYLASLFILSGDVNSLIFSGLAFIAIVFAIAILNDFRRGVLVFLGWLTVEDLVRKFLGNNMAIYFGKDLLVGVVYLSFFLAWRKSRSAVFRPPFLLPLLLFLWLGIAQIFNPSSPSIVFGLLGTKLFFYYVPLMLVGYALIDSEQRLRRFFVANALAALFVAGLGIVQSIVGPSFLNPSHLQEDIRELSTLYRVAPLSGELVYRPNSVFVSGGRYGDYLLLQFLLMLGFTGYLLLRHRRGRGLAFLAVGTLAGGIMLAASRGILLWSLGSCFVVAAAFLWGASWRQKEVIRVLRSLQRALLGIGLSVILLMITFPGALLGRFAVYSETLDPRSPASELVNRVRDYPIKNFVGAFNYPNWPLGYGIGTTALGTQYVARFFHVRSPVQGVESGFGTLVVEMGVVGLILWLFLAVAIVVSGWKVLKQLRGSPWFPVGFVIWWYAFLLLLPISFMGIQPYEDFIMNAYLWLFLGVLFRLPKLVPSAQFALNAAPAESQRRVG